MAESIKEKKFGLRLGEILVMNGWITWEQLEKALQIQKKSEMDLSFALQRAGLDQLEGQVLHLGEILIKNGMISWDQLGQVLKIQRESGRLFGEILIEKGFITSKELHRALALQWNKTFADFKKINIAEESVKLVPRHIALQYGIVPLVRRDRILLIAISDPTDVLAVKELSQLLPDYEIHTAIACPLEIQQALKHYYP